MLHNDEIRRYRALAAKYPGNVSSTIINKLLDELQAAGIEIRELRLKTADKYGEYDDFTPCPFGKEHKGQLLKDVPDDWLRWWLTQNSREEILTDMDFGRDWGKRAMAVKKLRLYDYLTARRVWKK